MGTKPRIKKEQTRTCVLNFADIGFSGSDIQPITVKLVMTTRESSARDSRETRYVFEHLDDAVFKAPRIQV